MPDDKGDEIQFYTITNRGILTHKTEPPFTQKRSSFKKISPVNRLNYTWEGLIPEFYFYDTFFYTDSNKLFLVNPIIQPANLEIQPVRVGQSGYYSQNLNQALNLLGYRTFRGAPNPKIYDLYTEMTHQAVKKFQAEQGITDLPHFIGISGITSAKLMEVLKDRNLYKDMVHIFKPKFSISFHPFIDDFIRVLNRDGLISLLGLSTQKMSNGLADAAWKNGTDSETNFAKEFKPNPGFIAGPYPRENVDFSPTGAYSLYNWEIFYHTAILTATHLSKNQQYEQAMGWFHYIFDPTSNDLDKDFEETIATPTRFWKFLPFKLQPKQSLLEYMKEINEGKQAGPVAMWRDHPFRPHLVARSRVIPYMRYTIMAYLDNLIAWGDMLFRQDTIESINEATNLYVMASHILGPRPQKIPARSKPRPETFTSIHERLDALSNAGVPGEASLPYSTDISFQPSDKTYRSLVGIGSTLYFCIPSNEKMLGYWDTVADRLFKIRHCMNIQGVERQLALFEPPIDPGLLASAVAGGMSIGGALADLNAPLPFYRFQYMLQKAVELCAEVKALGNAMLSAIEKRDAEHLSVVRSVHEVGTLKLVHYTRLLQTFEAKSAKTNLIKAKEIAVQRLKYNLHLLNVPVHPIPDEKSPAFTPIQIDIDDHLAAAYTENGGKDLRLLKYELSELLNSYDSLRHQDKAMEQDILANYFHLIPNFSTEAEPLGVGFGIHMGGQFFAFAASTFASFNRNNASHASGIAANHSKIAGYTRRLKEWEHQANLAGMEISQILGQLHGADIRIAISEQEMKNQQKQIENAEEIARYLIEKYTKEELYEWMRGEILATYKEAYNLAYDLAKRAERAYRFELGDESAKFIQYGYWNNAKDGLLSGEKLHLALKQMEKAYQENNRREFEITKNISLQMLDPLALIELKQRGKCTVQVPEVLFDMDYPGHYLRRIRSVAISIPCIAGPYTSVNCSLTLVSSKIRRKPASAASPEEDEQFFETSHAAFTSIATSHGQNDSGMFELNFRDERYLPFEGAGVDSQWGIELPNEFRTFNYDTISDVILHIRYTSRPGTDMKMKQNAIERLKVWQGMVEGASQSGGLMHLISFQHEFPSHWHRLLTSGSSGELEIPKSRFPYFVQGGNIETKNLNLYVKLKPGISSTGIEIKLSVNGGTPTLASLQTSGNPFAGLYLLPVAWIQTINDAQTGKVSLAMEAFDTLKDKIEEIWMVFNYTIAVKP